ncbi:MAG TPA: tail fiber domain-containing protein [Calditerricola sp.]
MNRETAITQQQLNMMDQFNPWGSVTYEQTGTRGFYDSNGNWVETPTYSQTVTLTPEQQAIFDQTQQAQGNLATIAQEQSDFLRNYLNEPFEFNNQDAANWAYDLGAQRLDPRFAQEEERLRTQLINQGLRPGTAAWDAEMTRLSQSKNDAYNQLMLTGRSQAFNEALATRSQPINELTALLSGSQVTNPGTASPGTPQTGVAGVDYTGLVNQQYQARAQQSAAGMGGLFGLLGAGVTAFSDARLKTDVRRIGQTAKGIPLYTFRYKGDSELRMGVLAQEVEEIRPAAVVRHPSGYLMVDYGQV